MFGAYGDCAAAAGQAVHITREYEPDPGVSPAYEAAFQRFAEAYESLEKSVFV